MAVYERNQGQLPPSSNAMPALPSRDIGSIIVRSLQNALSADSGSDDELPDKIAEGINRSDIVSGQKKGGVAQNGEGNSKSPIDNLLKSGETARTKAYEKHLKKEEDAEKKARREREARDRAAAKAFETTLRGLSTFAQNPLKGLDNVLQAGFKGLFKFGNNLMHKSLGDINKDMKKAVGVVTAPARAVGGLVKGTVTTAAAVGKVVGGGIAKATGIGLSQEEKEAEIKKNSPFKKTQKNADGTTTIVEGGGKNQGKTFDASGKEVSKQAKDQKEAKEANVEKKRDKQAGAQLAETAKTNLTVGMIFGKLVTIAIGLAAVAVLFPIIAGHLADLVLNFKYAAKEAPVKFGAFMRKAKAVLFGGLYELAGKLKWPWGGGSLLDPSLSKEEKAEKEELSQNEMVKSYINAQTDAERYKKVMESDEYQKRKAMYERGEMSEMDKAHFEKEEAKMKKTFENLKFYEGTAIVKRWNELNLDPTKAGERMMAEAEDWENEEYGKLYKGMLERGEITANQAAWAMTKGGGSKSVAAAQSISEFTDKVRKGEASFAPETWVETGKRRGLQVEDDFVNLFGELGHNLFRSTKSAYQKRNTADPNATLDKAVQNYHNTVNNITTATPSNMGAGPR